jgi:hypothetical protein
LGSDDRHSRLGKLCSGCSAYGERQRHDLETGLAREVLVIHSGGHKILDQSALEALRQ